MPDIGPKTDVVKAVANLRLNAASSLFLPEQLIEQKGGR